MEEDKIIKAFKGRWRVKMSDFEDGEVRMLTGKDVKRVCYDFFKAGMLINEIEDGEITPAGFDDFWSLYDKKVGKPKCQKLWAKLSSKEKKDCMEYIPLYKQAQPDKTYRKNPETFLRNKSWHDELYFRQQQPTQQQQQQERLNAAARVISQYNSEG